MSQKIAMLHPPMTSPDRPCWEGALWIGSVASEAEFSESVVLSGSDGYQQARLLVTSCGRPAGFAHFPVIDGALSGDGLRSALPGIVRSGHAEPGVPFDLLPRISVVICTRNRPRMLAEALKSVLASSYPHFNIVIVDNAPDDDSTSRYVESLGDPAVTLVRQPVPGLSVARNTGAEVATGELIAFTDDDVVVDPNWLHWLGRTFAAEPQAGCITGLVASGEVRTPTQRYFEQQVSWSTNLERTIFDLARPPLDSKMFPFRVGAYGTGANFAMPRDVLFQLGGFDEGLGVGAPTGGGEDIDMFVRVLLGGHRLVYEPAATVWHRHRSDIEGLRVQARGYGLGLGAWLTKVAFDRKTQMLALRKSLNGARHLSTMVTSTATDEHLEIPKDLRRAQLLGIARGPISYARARREGRRPSPLLRS